MLSLRDRLLSSPDFQKWALRFPLTRFIARRRAAALFDLCAGFVYSQILLACVRLRLFAMLADGPRTVSALAEQMSLPPESTLTLLQAAEALGLVELRAGGHCGLGRHGAALLGNPGLLPMIEHHSLLYSDLADPVALLRGTDSATRLSDFWSYACAPAPAEGSTAQVSAYTSLMSASQSFIAHEVLDAYDFGSNHSLLDIGGGDGTFCVAAARRAPGLSVTCFDLPAVASKAEQRFEAEGLNTRAVAVGGDFKVDPLPRGADVVSLIRVLHDHDDSTVFRVLRAVADVLPAHGTVVIAEPMAGFRDGGRVAEAYFGFYLMAMRSGRPRSREALELLLRRAGFEPPHPLRTRLPMNVRVLVARRKKVLTQIDTLECNSRLTHLSSGSSSAEVVR